MSEFDPSKDKEIRKIGIVLPAEGSKGSDIHITVNSYDGGEPKLRLIRVKSKSGGDVSRRPIGGMTQYEIAEVIKLLNQFENIADAFTVPLPAAPAPASKSKSRAKKQQ